jgi:hypothetical protein
VGKKSYVLVLKKHGWAKTLGDFFTNPSGHPGHQERDSRRVNESPVELIKDRNFRSARFSNKSRKFQKLFFIGSFFSAFQISAVSAAATPSLVCEDQPLNAIVNPPPPNLIFRCTLLFFDMLSSTVK